MRILPRCLFLALAAALPATVYADGAREVHMQSADVSAKDGGRLLYRETHYVVSGRQPERWVVYRCPDGRPFARKHVRQTAVAAAPDFAFEDGRDGHREGVSSVGDRRIVFLKDGGESLAHPLSVPVNGVIDAGFDVAVRAAWDDLMQGKPVRLQFLIPTRQRFYPVRVQRDASIDWHGVRAERLRMTVDAWYGFAAPDVILVYARDDRRLLEFDGMGNVRDAQARHPQVRIVFAGAPAEVPADELPGMQRLALDGRCRF